MPTPIITFKAGICDLDSTSKPFKISPQPQPGYLYIYEEDGLHHLCWRPRAAPLSEPTDMDLIMLPGDATFKPLPEAAVNGRVFILRFSSSSKREFFWLQSKSQHAGGDTSWFSPRDLKLGEIVNSLIQGEDVDVQNEISNLPSGGGDDDDTAMEDAEGGPFSGDHHRAASGGAGAGATGGDIRDEGEESREGGADGGRAAAAGNDVTQAAVANFLKSLQSGGFVQQQKPFTTLPDLLAPATTLPSLSTASDEHLDALLMHVPLTILLLASGQSPDEISSTETPDEETLQGIAMSLSPEQKRAILEKVLRSPQFMQSLGSLTMAIRDGGLPSIADALGVKVEGGGFIKGGAVPLGGGEAVEAFLNGIKESVEREPVEKEEEEGAMDTD